MEEYLIEVITGKKKGFAAGLVRGILAFLEMIFYFIYLIRYNVYRYGLAGQEEIESPVISIGNITTGGTGKTPVVSLLADILQNKGRKVAIVSRGYRAGNKEPQIVADRKEILVGPGEAGDEAAMMARLLTGVPLVTGQDRVKAGELAVEEFQPDVILLDDGFQHWRLARELDIVLIDAMNPFGGEHLLPRGFLREPLSALKRAGVFLITRSDCVPVDRLNQITDRLRVENGEAPIFTASYRASYLRPVGSRRQESYLNPEEIKGKRVLGFSGIGNPESFSRTLAGLEPQLLKQIVFADHHQYQKEDFHQLVSVVRQAGIDLVVTTEKDIVKIQPEMLAELPPVFVLGIEVEISNHKELVNLILSYAE